MWVKICGITNLEDALHACLCGADALGFVFYPKSPRFIEPRNVKEIVKKLPLHIKKVGLFVDCSAAEINLICQEAGLDMAQIYGEVNEAFHNALEVPYLRVIRAQKQDDIFLQEGTLRLVDAYVPNYGGEGKRIPLSWFENHDNSHIIIAGGLNADNLDELIPLGFYGVDVSSGVEQSHGIKDKAKVKAFIEKAKA
ncbi:MAG: phosphoribosylanthranilate isomerase [Sulfurospirillaceae bacterium]|nr:phosphoribosylanthranilate isomerase [Sulfurospirillaceae bacterium]